MSGFIFALGLIFGSFANVLIVRLPKKKSVIKPGSQCPLCHHKLSWRENIPVFSFFLLKGKCRSCKKKINLRYPMVEILTSVLFLAVYQKNGFEALLFIRDLPFVVLLVAITFIDLEHRIIPDSLSLGGLVLGLVTSWFVEDLGTLNALYGAGLGFLVFYGLAWIYEKMTGKMGLGGGDIKLLAMLGSFLGPLGVVQILFISSVTGSLVGICLGIIQKEKNIMKTSIPYGPFLVIGALFYYLLGYRIWFPFMTPI